MTKFDDWCLAYKNARKKYSTYQTDCFDFAQTLVDQLINRFQIPKEQIKCIPTNKEPEEDSTYTVPGAMHLDNDTYWHLGLLVTLYESPKVYPHQQVKIVFLIKKNEETFEVRLQNSDDYIEIEGTEDKEHIFELLDYLHVQLLEEFKSGLHQFLEKDKPAPVINFTTRSTK